MAGEKDLDILLRSLTATLDPQLYVFVTVKSDSTFADITNLNPRMVFQEAEGTTLIITQSEAELKGLSFEFPCRMITLDVHSSLEAVGFIAKIATELAKHGMGVNPVSGFYHDHLFVPDGREKEAMAILKQISEGST